MRVYLQICDPIRDQARLQFHLFPIPQTTTEKEKKPSCKIKSTAHSRSNKFDNLNQRKRYENYCS